MAFLWGSGGRRMTPEQIALERRMAVQQQMDGADFSPVGHWTQGLARVAQGLMGGLRENRAARADEANVADSERVIQALMGSGTGAGANGMPTAQPDNAALVEALNNPYINDSARGLAQSMWERANPKPPQPTEIERLATAAGYAPGSQEYVNVLRQGLNSKIDPEIVVPLPTGTFVGPRSELAAAMGAGEAPAPAPMTAALPSGGTVGNHAALDGAMRLLQSLGPQGFHQFQQQNDLPVLVNSPEEMAALPAGTLVISADGRRGVKR